MFSPEHHALVLGYFIQEILRKKESLVSKAVCEYGELRGRRMAQTALADNRKTDLTGFLLYGEFDWKDTGNRFKLVRRKPFVQIRAERCFWHDTWLKADMQEVGKVYCRDIDQAVIKGFNPELNFEVSRTMGAGDPICLFNYHGWQLGIKDFAAYVLLKHKVKKRAVKSWEFHCVDVFKVFSHVAAREWAGDSVPVIRAVRKRFSDRFGEAAARQLDRS